MQFTDMSLSEQDSKNQYGSPTPDSQLPKYPYGLCISLCKTEIDKLDLDINDCEVGDFLHLHSLAKVTSKSVSDTEAGSNPRIELCLAFIDIEDEGEEDKQADKGISSKLYK